MLNRSANIAFHTLTEFCEEATPRVPLKMGRVQESLVAAQEKRALLWLAARTPQWIGSDHLTVLGLVAQIGAGGCYALARWNKYALLGAIRLPGAELVG
jgi:hypothetical protein